MVQGGEIIKNAGFWSSIMRKQWARSSIVMKSDPVVKSKLNNGVAVRPKRRTAKQTLGGEKTSMKWIGSFSISTSEFSSSDPDSSTKIGGTAAAADAACATPEDLTHCALWSGSMANAVVTPYLSNYLSPNVLPRHMSVKPDSKNKILQCKKPWGSLCAKRIVSD